MFHSQFNLFLYVSFGKHTHTPTPLHTVIDMDNATIAMSHSSTAAEDVVAIVLIPIIFSLLFYATMTVLVWPYARPVIPLWIIIFAILFPPFFFFLVFYLLFVALPLAPIAVEPVYVVEKPNTMVRAVIVERSPRSSPRRV
jgi:hypothetical protein